MSMCSTVSISGKEDKLLQSSNQDKVRLKYFTYIIDKYHVFYFMSHCKRLKNASWFYILELTDRYDHAVR